MTDKNIEYLNAQQFHSLLSEFKKEYETVKPISKYLPNIDKSFETLLNLHKEGKITPYKKTINNKFSLWLTFDKRKVSPEEEKLILKIAKFLLKIETFLKENNII